jgi:GTPase SAR1 family protein
MLLGTNDTGKSAFLQKLVSNEFFKVGDKKMKIIFVLFYLIGSLK